MSTRSRIGILKSNGSIESIYCHLDGYPEWVGKKLYRYYNDVDPKGGISFYLKSNENRKFGLSITFGSFAPGTSIYFVNLLKK